jgi:hypothetical protein
MDYEKKMELCKKMWRMEGRFGQHGFDTGDNKLLMLSIELGSAIKRIEKHIEMKNRIETSGLRVVG